MSATPALRGLYAITPAHLCRDPDRLLAAAESALRGGARLLQYRDKGSAPAARRRSAQRLLEACRRHAAALIINDDVGLCAEIGAAGVHLGIADLPAGEARKHLGAGFVIGVSCANDLARAQAAQAAGASYVAFGRFFPSRTKPDAPPATPGLLRAARRQIGLPICAIGGLTPENAGDLVRAGADLVAAVEGVFGADDIEAAARAYSALFEVVSS